MITKCPYCDYSKPDVPLSLPILRVMRDPDISEEDFLLWGERLVKVHKDSTSYWGVKTHIGRMHKGEYNTIAHIFNDDEMAIINEHTLQAKRS